MTTNEFPIVGIGASAGGIEAFHAFFSHMPADSGMAFVVILHLPADRKSLLSGILSRWTSMPVVEATDGVGIEPNGVYVSPPHAVVTLDGLRLGVKVSPDASDRVFRPIDGFFDSLAATRSETAVGIVLSGTGSDGALGLKAIKECGGLTIAQGTNGSAPEYGEMPAGAIATGAVDLICPVEEIPGHLLRLKNNRVPLTEEDEAAAATNAARLTICTLLRTHLGHDFSGYRGQTFLRRVQRRMSVVNARALTDYIEKLKADPEESRLLFRDLLIRVTSFFRDERIFQTLASEVIPGLFEGKMADATVRIWVPGCATGEEAYSLAILLREHMDSLHASPKVQVFATDIDESAIGTARLGRYPKTLLEGLSDERRQRFFTCTQGSYGVTREIRELCTFSVHNLVRDPPFSMMSLVSCRNLLIYMNPQLQARIIPLFHYALVPGGMLLLGGSESAAQHAHLFETVDKAARIFRRREGRSPELNLWQPPRLISQRSGTADGAMPRDPHRTTPHRAPAALALSRHNEGGATLGPPQPSSSCCDQSGRARKPSRSCKPRSQPLTRTYAHSPRSIRRRSRSCAAPMRSFTPSMRSCNRPTRSSRPRRKNCSRSTRSSILSIPGSRKRSLSSTRPTVIFATCSTVPRSPRYFSIGTSSFVASRRRSPQSTI